MIQTAYAGIIAAVPAFLSPGSLRVVFSQVPPAGLLGPILAGPWPGCGRSKCYEFIKSVSYPGKKVKKPVFSSYLRNEGVRKTQKQGLNDMWGLNQDPVSGGSRKKFSEGVNKPQKQGLIYMGTESAPCIGRLAKENF